MEVRPPISAAAAASRSAGARAAGLGGGLVEDDHGRVAQQQPGQGEPLHLRGGESV
jgi:hypothetical protein